MKEKILADDPHPGSRAGYLSLTEHLASRVVYTCGYRGWLRFRRDLLDRWLAERGELRCHYCSRGPLPIEGPKQQLSATLDHVMPLSLGGQKFDEKNLVVACYHCNLKKGQQMPDEFRI